MTITPLTSWRCDVCHQAIETTGDGYVTWHSDDRLVHGFKIIHRGKCDDNVADLSAALEDYLGVDGLTRIMAKLSYGPLRDSELPGGPRDMNEFVDFVRRVQVPYYEEARVHFSDPDVRERRSDWNEVLPYMQRELRPLAESGE